MKRQQKGPVGQRAPPPEQEDARVKCKDCGAFGHTARSVRCPMKRWAQTLNLQPLGPHKKDKENREPHKAPQLETPAPLSRTAREDRQRQRGEEEQRTVPLPKFPRTPQRKQQPCWKELTESPHYVRRPCRPMPLHTTNKRRPPVPPPTCRPPPEGPFMRSMGPALSPTRIPGLSIFLPPGRDEAEEVDIPDAHQPASEHFRLDPAATEQLTGKGPALCPRDFRRLACEALSLGHALSPQAPVRGPDVSSSCSPQPVTETLEKKSSPSVWAPGTRSAQSPTQACQNPRKNLRPSPFHQLRQGTQRPDQGIAHIPQAPPGITGLGPKEAPLYRWQGVMSTSVHGASRDFQDPSNRNHLSFVRACTTSQPPPLSQDPAQHLRMVFSRLENGWWSARFRTSPTSESPEKTADPGPSPQVSGEAQAQCPQGALRSLYEDLLVSSSEDSDCDWD